MSGDTPDNFDAEDYQDEYGKKFLKLIKNRNKDDAFLLLEEEDSDSWAGIPSLRITGRVESEERYEEHIFDFHLSYLSAACGVLVFHDFEYGYVGVKDKAKVLALVMEIVHDYAKSQHFGIVLSTNVGTDRKIQDKVAKELGIEIAHSFTSPKTKNKVHVYIADVTRKRKKSLSRGITQKVNNKVLRKPTYSDFF